jgi:MoaA/NifB/PqqE/SkfB family radical SAM enzyme
MGLETFADVHFSKYPLRLEGRAAEALSSHLKPRYEIPSGRCPFPFWIGGDFSRPETVEIDHEGNITLCPGLSIGNARDESLTDILNRYNVHTHPLISLINQRGPIALYELAKRKGYDGTHAFVDECHLCYMMRQYLQPYYTRFLSPSTCY